MTMVTYRPKKRRRRKEKTRKTGLFSEYGSTQINVHHYGREAISRAVIEVGIAARSSLQLQTGSRGKNLKMAGCL